MSADDRAAMSQRNIEAAHIRPVKVGDASALVRLFEDLSHPADSGQITTRIVRLQTDDTYSMWVAEAEDQLLGFAAGHIVFPIEDDTPAAQLIALVTSPQARGQGTGIALCETFERWAVSRGARRAVVNSGSQRNTAHDFYKSQGWTPTGLRLGKRL